jgi:hypothetical protein
MQAFVPESDSWGGPLGGVDMQAEAGFDIGGTGIHGSATIEVWTFIIIVGSLALLWLFGGVVFRRINIP